MTNGCALCLFCGPNAYDAGKGCLPNLSIGRGAAEELVVQNSREDRRFPVGGRAPDLCEGRKRQKGCRSAVVTEEEIRAASSGYKLRTLWRAVGSRCE